MKHKILAVGVIMLAGFSGECIPTPYTFAPASVTPYQEQQIEEANRLAQQQRDADAADIAAREAAVKRAAWEKFRNEAVARLAAARDAASLPIRAKYDPDLMDLKSQAALLRQKARELERLKFQSETRSSASLARQSFRPADPWRMVDGRITYAKGPDWVQFTGRVLEVKTNGILFAGSFGAPPGAGFGARNFFVENFPSDTYPMADGEDIPADMNLVAHLGGKAMYQFAGSTADMGVQTVRRLDYGKIVNSPPRDVVVKWQAQLPANGSTIDADLEIINQIEANQKQLADINLKLVQEQGELDGELEKINAEYDVKVADLPNVYAKHLQELANQKKLAIQDKVLKSNQDLADKGDPYGLLRMGERYRDGEGVARDLDRARDYLAKAAAAGSPTAVDELAQLNRTAVK